MKKWLLGVLLCLALLSSFVVPGVASAHSAKATRPASVGCTSSGCDGKFWDQMGCWNGGQDGNVHVIASGNRSLPDGRMVGIEILRSSTCGSVWTYSWMLDGKSDTQADAIFYGTSSCSNATADKYNGPYTRYNMWSPMVGELDPQLRQRMGYAYLDNGTAYFHTYVPFSGCVTF